MRQFEVRRLRSGDMVLLLQHEVLDTLGSRIVAPLTRSQELTSIERMRPTVEIDGKGYVILMDRLAAIDASRIGELVRDVRDIQDDVNIALDLLFKGF